MNLSSFKLDNENPKQTFSFQYSFSYINIKKIVFNSLLGLEANEWIKTLQELFLEVTLKDGYGTTRRFMIDIDSQISPYHRQPIVEFTEYIIPDENKGKFTTTKNYIQTVEVELKSNIGTLPKIELTIYFEQVPGVILLKRETYNAA